MADNKITIPEGFIIEQNIPEGFEIETSPPKQKSGVVEFAKQEGRVAVAQLEIIASVLTQVYGVPLAGLAGITAGMPRGDDPFDTSAAEFDFEKSEDVIEWVSKQTVYQPQSKQGQMLSEKIFYPFQKLHEAGEVIGDWTLEKTDSPGLATLASLIPEGAAAVAGGAHMIARGRAVVRAQTPKKITPESTFIRERFDKTFLKEEGVVPITEEVKVQLPSTETARKAQAANTRAIELGAERETVALTPEETFVREAEGMDGLRDTQKIRAETNAAVEESRPVDLNNVKEPTPPIDRLALIKERQEKINAAKKAEISPEDAQALDDAEFLAQAERDVNERFKTPTDEEALQDTFFGEESPESLIERDLPDEQTGRQFANDVPLDQIITDDGITLYGGLPLHKFAELYTKAIGEPIWDNLIMTKIPKIIERIPKIGKPILRAALYDYRGGMPDTPLYMDSVANQKRHQRIGIEYGLDLGNRLGELPERSQLVVGDRLRGLDVKMTEAEGILAVEARNALDSLGKQAVDVGLLSEETFFKNVGRYLPRLYTSKEYNGLMSKHNMLKPTRLEMSRFMKRKDIPADVRKELGEIMTPGYPVAKGIIQLTHDIELAKHFNFIAENKGWSLVKEPKLNKAGQQIPFKTVSFDPLTGEKKIHTGLQRDYPSPPPEGWVKLPESKKLGKLSEAYVQPEIAADIETTMRVAGKSELFWRKALGAWKFGKVILSPKTHARNLFSNSLLTHVGGTPLWRQPRLLIRASKEMRSKGQGKYWKMATEEGLLDTTWTEGELRALFDQVEFNLQGIKAEGLPEAMGKMGQAWQKAKIGANKAAKLYNAEEQWFKLTKFIDNMERKGMNSKAAAADAEKWLFNYSKLTPAQEAYRSKWYGAPFATFTLKALPRMAEAAIKTPWRFAAPAAMIYALEEAARKQFGDSKETSRAKKRMRSEWMQGSVAGIPNFPRVPVEDDSGREYYFNLSYIVPWGDIGEAGGWGPIPGGLVPLSQPFVKEAWQQIANYDNFWKEPIVKEQDIAGLSKSEQTFIQAKKRAKHLYNTMVPTLAMDIEKGIDAYRGQPDFRGRERSRAATAADVFLGFKMYPVDYADEMLKRQGKLNPGTSHVARQIVREINGFAAKRNHLIEKGQIKRAKKLDKKIAYKVRQLQGLGKELSKHGDTFKTIREAEVTE